MLRGSESFIPPPLLPRKKSNRSHVGYTTIKLPTSPPGRANDEGFGVHLPILLVNPGRVHQVEGYPGLGRPVADILSVHETRTPGDRANDVFG
jgi:hypothetical protein